MATFIAVFLCMALGGLIVQILRAEVLFWKVRGVVARAESVLGIIEGQHKASDAVADRVVGEVREVKRDTQRAATVAAQARDAAAAAVERVPEKVVGLLKSSDSGLDWKPGDPDRRSLG